MRHDPTEVKLGLQHIANEAPDHSPTWRGQRFRESALDALAYIRQLEGDLRRQGFTEYNEKEDNND
jgi:hypothetical protein